MATAVAMPRLGMTMEEGTLVSWQVALGERVEKGAILYVVETEKTEAEIEATASGVLRHVYVREGETVPCGSLLAALTETADEPFDVEAFRADNDRPEAPRPLSGAAAPAPAAGRAADAPLPRRRPVAPAARALARKLDVDPEAVPGTGPGGRVTRQDVEAFAAARQSLVRVADGVSLDVPRQGEGEVVLLLPGFGTDVSSFAPQIAALAEGHAVYGVNPRGVGLSDAPDRDVYPVEQSAADAAAVHDGPLHVVGASLGAAAALELALAHPDRVRTLTLVTPFLAANGRLVAVTEAWVRIAAAADAAILARALLPWLFSADFLADEKARERTARGLAASVARVPPATLARTAAGLRAWSGTRSAADLAALAVPTLVVSAGDDLLTPDTAGIAEAIPGARHLGIAGAGHAVGIEAGEAVAAGIGEHIG